MENQVWSFFFDCRLKEKQIKAMPHITKRMFFKLFIFKQ